jgi:hypothetical protein
MKIVFMPKSKSGKVSITLFLISLLLVAYFFVMVNVFGQRGGATFFSNLNLTIPMLLAWASGAAAFIFGIISIVKSKSYSILILLILLITCISTSFGIAEVIFPH